GLHAAEGGNAQHDIIAQTVIHQFKHARRAVALQVNQNRGDDLRVFVFDQFGNGARFQQVKSVDAIVGTAFTFQNVFNDAGGPVVAQRLVQNGADILFGAQGNGHELIGFLAEILQHL